MHKLKCDVLWNTLSIVAAAPPIRISGDCAIWAFLTAVIVFVIPNNFQLLTIISFL